MLQIIKNKSKGKNVLLTNNESKNNIYNSERVQTFDYNLPTWVSFAAAIIINEKLK